MTEEEYEAKYRVQKVDLNPDTSDFNSFQTILGLKNFIESHEGDLRYKVRGSTKMYQAIMDLLDQALESKDNRQRILLGVYRWRARTLKEKK